ncbi:MAG TPA: 1,2-phenylacetyl-CoA epoxidase subunit PaaC [Steroidobacteraceae bacterium]|nr:1,2-phenylacetyl-CoA epoxidase subunit PaaC [Steroidobacteraceae bacterium]
MSEVIPAQAQMTAAGAIGAAILPSDAERARYVLRLADTSLIVAQQLGAWIGHAPALEEELGIANIALDLLGQARLLLAYAGELEGGGRDEDALAFLRVPAEFVNVALAEQPNGDFADTVMRQLLLDAWQIELFEALERSRDERLGEIAAKAVKETRYHLRYSGGWVVRLGDGTAESHERTQQALQRLWPYTAELFDADPLEEAIAAAGIGPHPAALAPGWRARVQVVLAEATLSLPPPASFRWYGKRGEHNEHLGHLLAEMQILQRTYPGAKW